MVRPSEPKPRNPERWIVNPHPVPGVKGLIYDEYETCVRVGVNEEPDGSFTVSFSDMSSGSPSLIGRRQLAYCLTQFGIRKEDGWEHPYPLDSARSGVVCLIRREVDYHG